MTHAQTKGLKIGMKYTYTDPDGGSKHTVTFKCDDGSTMPSFYVPDEVNSNGDGWNYISLDNIEEISTIATNQAPYEVTVRVSDVGTLFLVTRQLSKQEIAAVFALLNK